jgi:hypothetical protein
MDNQTANNLILHKGHAMVYTPQKGWHKVTNLGWLLKHARDVVNIQVDLINNPSQPFKEVFMSVTLTEGRIYATTWSSAQVCKEWLHRPSLRGLPLFWLNHWTKC